MLEELVKGSHLSKLKDMKGYLDMYGLDEGNPEVMNILQPLEVMPIDIGMLRQSCIGRSVRHCANGSLNVDVKLHADYLCSKFKGMWWETLSAECMKKCEGLFKWQQDLVKIVSQYQCLMHEHLRFSAGSGAELLYYMLEQLAALDLDCVVLRYTEVERTVLLICESVKDSRLSALGNQLVERCINMMMVGRE